MASTPTSQITRVITTVVSNEPAANLAAGARFTYSSYLVQGDTAVTPRLEVEKAMVTGNSN